MLYSLYIKHHVGDGLLLVLLAVVEENLLAAHYNILEQQNRHSKVTLTKERLLYIIKAVSFSIPFSPIQTSWCCFLQGERASPPALFLRGRERDVEVTVCKHYGSLSVLAENTI